MLVRLSVSSGAAAGCACASVCVKSMAHIPHAKQLGTRIAHRIEIVIEFQMRRAHRSSSMSNFPSSTRDSLSTELVRGADTTQRQGRHWICITLFHNRLRSSLWATSTAKQRRHIVGVTDLLYKPLVAHAATLRSPHSIWQSQTHNISNTKWNN